MIIWILIDNDHRNDYSNNIDILQIMKNILLYFSFKISCSTIWIMDTILNYS